MLSKISRKKWLEVQENELGYWRNIVGQGGEPERCEYYLCLFGKYLENSEEKVMVDVGAGPRGILRLLNFKIGLAIDSLMGKYKEVGYSLENQKFLPIAADSENIPLFDNFADYVFSTNTLDHVQDANKVFEEMVRILKPKGKLFLIVDLRDENQVDDYHKICLDEEFFEAISQKCKVKVLEKKVKDSVSVRGLKSFISVFEK